jgi:hypothetical protein
MAEAEYWRFTVARDCQKKNTSENHSGYSLAACLANWRAGCLLSAEAEATMDRLQHLTDHLTLRCLAAAVPAAAAIHSSRKIPTVHWWGSSFLLSLFLLSFSPIRSAHPLS